MTTSSARAASSHLTTMPKSLPPGYAEAVYWRLTSDWRRLVAANLMGLISAPAATVVFGSVAVGLTGLSPLVLLGLGGAESHSGILTTLALIGVVAISMVAHELTHGAAIRLFGNRPSYGFQWAGLVPYATAAGQYFTRDQFVACALAPLVCLSVLGCLALPICPAWLIPWLVLGLIANAAGAVGDVWMSVIALRYPRMAWIMDERDGMRIFTPSPTHGRSSS